MKKTNKKTLSLALITGFILLAGCNIDGTLSAGTNSSLEIEKALPVHQKQHLCKVGINPFPYDLEAEAIFKTANTVRSNGDLYTVQLDNGIPWQDALDGNEFSQKFMEVWERHLHQWKADHQAIHLAIAPLSMDRKSWAGGFEGAAAPKWVQKSKGAVTPEIAKAYANYVRRATEYFNPNYLNIGVEAMDLAHNNKKNWAELQDLLIKINQQEKQERPNMQVGLSIGLPLLMQPEIFERTKKAINASDYLGISFYPHLAPFYKQIGGASLQSPPEQWAGPLDWVKANIVLNTNHRLTKRTPVAFSETSYSSEDVVVNKWGLSTMAADEELQKEYVIALSNFAHDLNSIGGKNYCLFVNFFLAIDYNALAKKIANKDTRDLLKFWMHSGFIDKDLKPKPAWDAYQQHWLNRKTAAPETTATITKEAINTPKNTAQTQSHAVPVGGIILESKKDLFAGASSSKFSLGKGPDNVTVMHWKYGYKKGEWAWAVKDFEIQTQSNARRLSFYAQSDRSGPLIIQLTEKGGETFFAQIEPAKSWGPIEIQLKDMTPDPQKQQNGKLEAQNIKSIMLADGASEKKAISGNRTVSITSPLFLP